jgi:hypothetical protein
MQLYDGRLVKAVDIASQTGFHLTVATPNLTLITVLSVVQLYDGRLVEAVGIPSRKGTPKHGTSTYLDSLWNLPLSRFPVCSCTMGGWWRRWASPPAPATA